MEDDRSESENESEEDASEEENDSEHGETTDYEEEVVSYWQRLQNGVVAYPSSLQNQCFLFIIGHLREIPPALLSLLPRSMRYKLLLHLPAVDVCQLEGTPVTSGITMEEIWERLCKERLAGDEDLPSYYRIDFSQITPEVASEKFGIDYTWKLIYFDSFLKLLVEHRYSQSQGESIFDSHFNSDHLFGIYRANETMELFDSFSHSFHSSHNVHCTSLKCTRFTPQRYIEYFENPKHVVCDIGQLMKLLANSCRYLPKHISISLEQLNFWEAIEEKSLQKEASLFLSSLEALDVEYLYNVSESCRIAKLEFIADLIFNKIRPHITTLGVFHRFDIIYPYIAKSKELCQLRKLTLICDATVDDVVSKKVLQKFKELEEVKIIIHSWPWEHNPVHTSKFTMFKPTVDDLSKSLRKFSESDDIKFVDMLISWSWKSNAIDTSKFTSFVGSMNDLFYYPRMKQLSFSTNKPVCTSGDIQAIFHHFFSSPYPVSLSLSLKCSVFSDQPQPQNIEYDIDQMSTKSLTVYDSSLSPDLVSLLPSNLSLRSLELTGNETSTLHCFSNLKSIKISDTFTLALTKRFKPDMDLLSQFLHIVIAKDWELDIPFMDTAEIILNFTSLVSSIKGHLQRLRIRYDRVEYSIFTLFDSIFHSISATSPPYFELGLTVDESSYDDEAVAEHYKNIYESWKKTGAAKLKLLEICSPCPRDAVEDIMSDMTIKFRLT